MQYRTIRAIPVHDPPTLDRWRGDPCASTDGKPLI